MVREAFTTGRFLCIFANGGRKEKQEGEGKGMEDWRAPKSVGWVGSDYIRGDHPTAHHTVYG